MPSAETPGGPDDPDRREPDDRAERESAAWQQIVRNYGDRPAFPRDLDDEDDEEQYVPPAPPPLPRPDAVRLAAWVGVLGAPVVMLLLALLHLSPPGWLALVLVASFLGGFGYLVWHMPRERDDPDDDGARV